MIDLYNGFFSLQEESKKKPMLLGYILDNWFGQDPGGGDIKDAAASGMTYMKDQYAESETILSDYYNQVLSQIGNQFNSMVKYYDENKQAGMTAYDAMNQSALKAYQEGASKAEGALSSGAQLAQDSMNKYYEEGMAKIQGVGPAPEFGEYDKTAYMQDPEYIRQKDEIIRNVKEFAAFSGAEGMTDDLAAIANEEITKLNNQFSDRAFNQQQTLYGNEMGAYQSNLSTAQMGAQMGMNQGANIAGVQLNTAQNQANIAQDLGGQSGSMYEQGALTKLQTNLQQGDRLAGAAGTAGANRITSTAQQGANLVGAVNQAAANRLTSAAQLGAGLTGAAEAAGANRITSTAQLGTNLANIKRELGAAGAEATIGAGMGAAEAQRMHDAAGNELFGTILGYSMGAAKKPAKKTEGG